MKNITHFYEAALGSNIKHAQLNEKEKYFITYEKAPGVPHFPLLIKPLYYALIIDLNHEMSETLSIIHYLKTIISAKSEYRFPLL